MLTGYSERFRNQNSDRNTIITWILAACKRSRCVKTWWRLTENVWNMSFSNKRYTFKYWYQLFSLTKYFHQNLLINYLSFRQCVFFWISFFLILSLLAEVYIPMLKIKGPSPLFESGNLHNWWMIIIFFAPLFLLRKKVKKYFQWQFVVFTFTKSRNATISIKNNNTKTKVFFWFIFR